MGDEKPGPTGDFPRGKLGHDDEGGLMVAIGRRNGCVLIDFGAPVAWVAMPPAEAVAFAQTIIAHARDAAREAGAPLVVEIKL